MPIVSAEVPACGWYVELVLACSAGSWADYQLGTDTAPLVRMLTTRQGFALGPDNTAVPAMVAQILGARQPLRKPFTLTDQGTKVLDEVLLPSGLRRVRLSLPEATYSTDSNLTLSVSAGWRTGEAAATVTVINSSTVKAPVPIVRWADVPFQLVRGAFTAEVKAASNHPYLTRGMVAVRFDLTDGISVRTLWATTSTRSAKYRGRTQSYSVVFGPDLLAGLQPGPLRLDWHAYPFVGGDRSSDPSGTRSMASLTTAPMDGGAQQPQVIAYDPDGMRYPQPIVYVDPTNGSDAPGAATVDTNDAVAYAGTAARSVIGAFGALASAVAKGRPNTSVDSAIIRLKPGLHLGLGSARLPATITALESWVSIEGDPRATSPSAVVLQTAAPPVFPNALTRFANMRLQINNASLVSTGGRGWWLDEVEVRGAPGTETNTAALIRSPNPWLWVTNTTWGNHGSSPKYSPTQVPLLIRDSAVGGQMQAPVIIGTDYLPPSSTNIVPAPTFTLFPSYMSTDPRLVEDTFIEDCSAPSLQAGAWAPSRLDQGPGLPKRIRRFVLSNNSFERIGSSPQPVTAIGEKEYIDVGYSIVENNHFLGERENWLYDDPNAATVADTNMLANSYTAMRVANNVFDHPFQKNDNFDDPDIKAVRVAAGVPGANGVRPQCVGSRSMSYGVGFRDNIDLGRHPMSGLFRFEDLGLGSTALYGAYPGFVRDACQYGSNQGQGDYRPALGSMLLARATTTNCAFDRAGVPRRALFAAGALEGLQNA